MAGQIAAHVTVTYPREIADLSELLQRVKQVAAGADAIPLALGDVYLADHGTAVLIEVIDRDGGYSRLRSAVVGPHASPSEPHVTLVHPDTSDRAAEAWTELRGQRAREGQPRLRARRRSNQAAAAAAPPAMNAQVRYWAA